MKIFICILFFYINFFSVASYGKETNKIVVKVDNELITSFDIKNKIISTLILTGKEINQKNINVLKKKSLDDLILNRLKKIELKKYDFKRDNSRINSYLNSISKNNVNSLKTLFKTNNVNFETYVNEIDVEFRWRNLIFQNYSKKILIDPKNIEDEIKKKSEINHSLIRYNLSEIEILFNGDDLINTTIKQIQDEIKNSTFEDAVIKFSISKTSKDKGQLGWVNSNSLDNELLKILQKMQIGDVTEPIKKLDKYIFLKLNDKQVTNYTETNLVKLKKEIIDQKRNELFALYSSSLLSKLRNNKFIEYYK